MAMAGYGGGQGGVAMRGVGNGNRRPGDDEYRCCCGSCAATDGARYLGMVEAVLVILHFAELITVQALAGAQFTVQFCVGFFGVVVWLAVIAALLYGVHSDQPGMIVPHIVMSAITIFTLFVCELMLLVMVASEGQALAFMIGMEGSQNNLSMTQTTLILTAGIIMMVVYLFLFMLECWALCIVWAAYRCIRERQDSMPMYGQPQVMYNKPPGVTY